MIPLTEKLIMIKKNLLATSMRVEYKGKDTLLTLTERLDTLPGANCSNRSSNGALKCRIGIVELFVADDDAEANLNTADSDHTVTLLLIDSSSGKNK